MFLLKRKVDALRWKDFAALRSALLGSPLVGATTLNGPFNHSRGYAMTFTEKGIPTVLARTPTLAPHFAKAVGPACVRALTPWFRRAEPGPNAWFLNLLLVSEGGAVGRHVDATLRGPSAVPDLVPLVVSVLYLSVPEGDGGELRVWNGDEVLGTVQPAENVLVHFRGDLGHDVSPLSGLKPGAVRASLVIEQYRMPPEALARIPEFHLESQAGFGAYLRAHAGGYAGPGRTFEVD